MTDQPPLIVLEDPVVLADLRAELATDGWVLRSGFPPLDDSWPLPEARSVYVGSVDRPEERVAAIRAGARGAGLVIVAPPTDPAFEEDLRRLGEVTTYARGDLTPRMVSLLRARAEGQPVKQAARELHISEASAWRAIRAARELLGVATTNQAVTEAIQRYGPAGPRPDGYARRG
jgi:DNA-binding CsgD family transcriptional regulator